MNRFCSVMNAVVCIVVLALIFATFSKHMEDPNVSKVRRVVDSGWTYEDGTDADPTDLVRDGRLHRFSRTLTPEEVGAADLCFVSSNLYFSVYLDDELIYDFHPDNNRFEGIYYGDYIHYVYLPDLEGERTISFEYKSLYDNRWTSFREMRLQPSRKYQYEILENGFPRFMICALVVCFGILIAIFGLVFDKNKDHRVETTALGAFAMIMGVWTNSGTMVIQSLTDNSVVTRLLDYYSLMLLPLPVMVFSAAFTRNLRSPLLKLSIGTVLLNVAANMIYVVGMGNDYHDTLFLSHISIGINTVFFVLMVRKAIKERSQHSGSFKYLAPAFSILIASGFVDMVRFYFSSSDDTAMFSRIGLMIFTVILVVYEYQTLLEVSRKNMEMEVVERMAKHDSLTGLGNRYAYVTFEEQLAKRTDGRAVFVQFDINDLKTVNDTYGHAEGDRHIKAAADILIKSFGDIAECFRMGGDEFLAIVTAAEPEAKYKAALEKLLKLQEEYNRTEEPPVKMCLAYGMAVYVMAAKDPESASRLADLRMYECKAKQKAAGQIVGMR